MTISPNPYIAGNPVGDSHAFVGRDDVLRAVTEMLRDPHRNALLLYGQRRIGKTSILLHLAARLPELGPYLPVYFDLQDKAQWPLARVLQALARTIARQLKLPVPDLGKSPETAFRETWLPDVLQHLPAPQQVEDSGLPNLFGESALVLLFDEFDALADPQKRQTTTAPFFEYLRDLLGADSERLRFVFVIGRNIDDLDTLTMAVFKGIQHRTVSLFNHDDTAKLARLSETAGALHWPDDAVDQVWVLTGGHPFLTQTLCAEVFLRLTGPDVTPPDVAAAIPKTLEAAHSALVWLWDGLGPAERVVASALAEAGPRVITEAELRQLLRDGGLQTYIRDLQDAPALLKKWDIVAEEGPGRFRFRVELLRQWIAGRWPLRALQKELDRLEPAADGLFQAALTYYRGGKLLPAAARLREAIGLNPNHIGATQLLTDILLAQGQADEARHLLERLYEYQPGAARARLVQALLALARDAVSMTQDEDAALTLYGQVVTVEPGQPEAEAGLKRIWQQRAEVALRAGDLAAAFQAYTLAGVGDKAASVHTELRRRELAAKIKKIEAFERAEQYLEADALLAALEQEYPDGQGIRSTRERLRRRAELKDLYQQAIGALQAEDRETAVRLLVQVVALDATYKEATRYLHQTVTQVDVAEVQAQLTAEQRARCEAENRAAAEAARCRQYEADLAQMQAALQTAQAQAAQWENASWWRRLIGLPAAKNWEQEVRAEKPTPHLQTVLPELILIPAGEFWMGSDPRKDKEADADEKPQHSLYLPDYWIARAPVTNAQYAAFVRATGHKLPAHWKKGMIPRHKPDHPVVAVSWDDALAYCRWLTEQCPVAGLTLKIWYEDRWAWRTFEPGTFNFQLPSEAEWEKAARGTDGRLYPWGNEPPDVTRCNFGNHVGDTTSVGHYSPSGDSPYGCLDMVGNVWEWTRSLYKPYPYDSVDGREDLQIRDRRVVRGGAFSGSAHGARGAVRPHLAPELDGISVGFRVVTFLKNLSENSVCP